MGKTKYEVNLENWSKVRNFTSEDYEKSGKSKGNTYAYYSCTICGELRAIQCSKLKTRLTVCDNGCHGSGCHNNKTLKGVNDIATTHPYLVKYFANREDAEAYKIKSNKKALFRCPNCGFEKEMSIDNFAVRGFLCDVCNDGISFPERFMSSLLTYIGIAFKREYRLGDCLCRYDFFIESHQLIIETHGRQHYETGFLNLNGRSLEEEQANDRYKYELAIQNGIERYIVIDCRKSELEWIKNSIANSNLPSVLEFDMEGIDWSIVLENCKTNQLKEICDYYEENKEKGIVQISKELNMTRQTLRRKLKLGTSLGLCSYVVGRGRHDEEESK